MDGKRSLLYTRYHFRFVRNAHHQPDKLLQEIGWTERQHRAGPGELRNQLSGGSTHHGCSKRPKPLPSEYLGMLDSRRSSGAGSSNLALGAHSASAISLYIADPGRFQYRCGASPLDFTFTRYKIRHRFHQCWRCKCLASVWRVYDTAQLTFFHSLSFSRLFSAVIGLQSLVICHSRSQLQCGDSHSKRRIWQPIGHYPKSLCNRLWRQYHHLGFPAGSTTFSGREDVVFEVTVSGVTNAPQSSYTYVIIAIQESTPAITFSRVNRPHLSGQWLSNRGIQRRARHSFGAMAKPHPAYNWLVTRHLYRYHYR